jgi:hypothetical protein
LYGVDFHVHKAILSFESIFFRDMFSLPEPVGEDANLFRDGKPVVTLNESSQAVRKLLVLCYPRYTSDELVSSFDGVDDAYVAADKHMVTQGQDLLEKLLADRRKAPSPRLCHRHPSRNGRLGQDGGQGDAQMAQTCFETTLSPRIQDHIRAKPPPTPKIPPPWR